MEYTAIADAKIAPMFESDRVGLSVPLRRLNNYLHFFPFALYPFIFSLSHRDRAIKCMGSGSFYIVGKGGFYQSIRYATDNLHKPALLHRMGAGLCDIGKTRPYKKNQFANSFRCQGSNLHKE